MFIAPVLWQNNIYDFWSALYGACYKQMDQMWTNMRIVYNMASICYMQPHFLWDTLCIP